jgi:antitoxin CptB
MAELGKLRWQCRRGCKELDLLLTDYLENRYPQANNKEKALFQELLKLDDTELLKQVNLLSNEK